MSQVSSKFVSVVASIVLAVSLIPLPAFAHEQLAPAEVDAALFGADDGALGLQELPNPQLVHYKWYTDDPSASEFTLGGGSYPAYVELVAFANLVNGTAPASAASGPVDFAGKTVKISSAVMADLNLGDAADAKWTPIGDAQHQFKGSFDGNGKTIDYFAVSGVNRCSYLGLFGYVGEGGCVKNVTVGSHSSINVTRAQSSTDAIHHVAGVAGYCAGTMSGCVNRASVSVKSAVVQSTSNPRPVSCIGGVAGECVFDMTDSLNDETGTVTVSETSKPVEAVGNSGLVFFVGGVAGVLGNSSRIGTNVQPIATDPSTHGKMSSCTNLAKLDLDTPAVNGKNQQNTDTYARSVGVGGVVGYSQGSVSGCVNGSIDARTADVGYIRAAHGADTGGIAGSLRGAVTGEGQTNQESSDDGVAGKGNDPIEASGCVNYGDVYGLNGVGGIVGHMGCYTSVAGSLNCNKQAKGTYVVATRANKPAPGGIVGTSYGDVKYCANFATIASATWSNEDQRLIERASGYYASGIAGMLFYYDEDDDVPMPQLYGCYNAGTVAAISGMRTAGLVGQNEGYLHDNVLLQGTVTDGDVFVYERNNLGPLERNEVLPATPASSAPEKGMREKYAVACLNGYAANDEWSPYYWVMSDTSAVNSVALNMGYPVLQGDNPVARSERIDLSAYSATWGTATYSGGTTGGYAAVPSVGVVSGTGEALVQNVDYKVVPDTASASIGSGHAGTVVGIGRYKGQISGAYEIVVGKLSDCRVVIGNVKFDFDPHYPDNVKVYTPGGTEVSSDEYEIESVVQGSSSYTADNPPVEGGTYTVTLHVKNPVSFSATEGTTVKGEFLIAKADLRRDVDYANAKITVSGKSYPWVSSTSDNVDNPATTLAYTGSAIKPAVSGIYYNGHLLQEGVDYQVVYGNANSGNNADSNEKNNIGVAYCKATGVVAVRYRNGSARFENFENMYFNIVDNRTRPVTPATPATKPMYRLYNPNSGEHFYTSDASERDHLAQVGWSYEGIGWYAPLAGQDVYRLYNAYAGDHHYTLDASERDHLVSVGWSFEGVGWKSGGSVPLYRQYNPNAKAGSHNYTTSKSENDWLVSLGWRAEGVGWYGVS